MKVFRFMSKEEFEKYKNGEVLENNKKHEGKTNSIGFCFLDMNDFTPERAMHFLSGVASLDICAVFETEEKLCKTYGIYAKPIDPSGNLMEDMINLLLGYNDHFTANEYCIVSYSKKKFKLLKYSEDIWKQWNPTEIQDKLKWKERI